MLKQGIWCAIITTLFVYSTVTADELRLNEALDLFEVNGYPLQIQDLRVKQAHATLMKGWTQVLPNLDITGERIHNELRGTRRLTTGVGLAGSDPLAATPIDARRLRLNFRQPLYDRRISQSIGLSKVRHDASALEYERVQDTEFLNVIEAFYGIARHQYMLDTAAENVELLKRHVSDLKAKQLHKLQTKNDVLKIEVELAKTQEEMLEHEQNILIDTVKLNHLLNQSFSTKIVAIDDESLDLDVDLADRRTIFEESLEYRPDLIRLNKQKAALKYMKGIEQSKSWPKLTFQGSYGFTKGADFNFSNADRDWLWSIVGSIQVFDGFSGQFEIIKLDHQMKETELQILALEDSIVAEVEQNINLVQLAQERLKNSLIKLESAEENLRVVNAKYRHKQLTRLDVLYAKKDLQEARRDGNLAKIDYKTALFKLYVSMGRNPRSYI